MSSRRFFCAFALIVAGALLTPTAQAQDRYLAEIYGQGVHAFHRGNFQAASQMFNDAIVNGLQDPRAYYFRAFTKMRYGDVLGARDDIQMGAKLEVNGAGTYRVGLALERVQGPQRIRFERVRRTELIAAQRTRASTMRQPMVPSTATPSERDFLRSPVSPEATKVDELDVPPVAPGEENPFADEGSDEHLMEPHDHDDDDAGGEDPLDGVDNPFDDEATDPGAAGDAGEDDIFSDEPAPTDDTNEEAAPEAEVDEGSEDDLFGDDGEDLFGE